MIKLIQVILLIILGITSASGQAAITLYNGSGSIEEQSWLIYGQVPLAESLLPSLPATVSALLAKQLAPLAEGVGTATLNTNLGKNNSGYAGYANYQYSIPLESISLTTKPAQILASGSFDLVNPEFPSLDQTTGFELAFNVAITSESSKANRAGFSVIVIAQDGKGIELGFKREKKSDRIFAQGEKFTEAEDTSEMTLDLTEPTDYVLKVQGDEYTLLMNETGILSGKLRAYQFNPTKSSPPLPFNPYETPNFLFFGDDTDQGQAEFTLGTIAIDGAFSTDNTSTQIPQLGQAYAVNAQGEAVEVNTTFAGGISVNGDESTTPNHVTLNRTDKATINGEITVDPQHVGQLAQLILVATHNQSCEANADKVFYMVDTMGNIIGWNQNLEELVAFQDNVILQSQQSVKLYDDQLPASGCIEVYFGYLLADGVIVVNENNLYLVVEES
jgi:hypothetical protein